MKLIAICANMDPLIGLYAMKNIIDDTKDLIQFLTGRADSVAELEENKIRLKAYKLQYDITLIESKKEPFQNLFLRYSLDLYPTMKDLHKRDKSRYIHKQQIFCDSLLTLKIKIESLTVKSNGILSEMLSLNNMDGSDVNDRMKSLHDMHSKCLSERSALIKEQLTINQEIWGYEDGIESLERAIVFCEYFHKCMIYYKQRPVNGKLPGIKPEKPDFYRKKAQMMTQIIQSLHARLTQLERLHATPQ